MSITERVMGWDHGLPNSDDLTPLSQSLIPLELASAFSISPEACRTANEVNRASQATLSSIRGINSNNFIKYSNEENNKNRESFVIEYDMIADDDVDESEARKIRRFNSPEEADSGIPMEGLNDDNTSKLSNKRHRLVWTPQLHKRFVEVVAHLGIKNSVPKTIMQLMNVEGLTRENVASHLQKYRLYLKRKEGLPNDDPSSSDPVFESAPVPQGVRESSASENGHGHVHMPYPPPMIQMPGFGVGHGHMGLQFGNPNAGHYQGFESHPYNMLQQRNWPSYPHISPNEK